jgi:hypothetical protein
MRQPQRLARLLSLGWLLLSPLVACDGGGTGTPPPPVEQPGQEDLAERLRRIEGLTVTEQRLDTVPAGYRFFVLEYEQPADHAQPQGPRFKQRMTLLHTSDAAPMVLHTGGYYVSTRPSRSEPTQLLEANQLSVEHRFFLPSRPEPADWSHLTIKQSADDFHRLVTAFKPLYPGRWVSTGGSKGGETVVFFRRFYPADVDATVAYVAPIARRDDERFPAFQEAVGEAACRERLKAFQRALLERRAEALTELDTLATEQGLTFEHLGREKALEHAVIESSFAFWQYGTPGSCATRIPAATATTRTLMRALDDVVDVALFSDSGLAAYGPYYHQAATQLGYPRPFEAPIADLLRHPGTDIAEEYVPRGAPFAWDGQAMPDVQSWVSQQGERLLFIYGGFDPWTAAAYELGGASARDSHLFTVSGGNHGARIQQLPVAERDRAISLLKGWTNRLSLPPRPLVWKPELPEEEFGPHLPPPEHLRPGASVPAAR